MNNENDVFEDVRKVFAEIKKSEDAEAEEYWNSLSKDDQMKAFYAVVKRIVKGELKDKGSYRYILYDVFGFGMESYLMGMNCGFMDLHNSISDYDLSAPVVENPIKDSIVARSWKCPIGKEDCTSNCGNYGCEN
jgi:hypothetical protein